MEVIQKNAQRKPHRKPPAVPNSPGTIVCPQGSMPQDFANKGLINDENWDSRRWFYGHEAAANLSFCVKPGDFREISAAISNSFVLMIHNRNKEWHGVFLENRGMGTWNERTQFRKSEIQSVRLDSENEQYFMPFDKGDEPTIAKVRRRVGPEHSKLPWLGLRRCSLPSTRPPAPRRQPM